MALTIKSKRMAVTIVAALSFVPLLSACDDDKQKNPINADHPTLQRAGCVAPPPGHGPNIIADRTWQELTNNGLAWVVIIMRKVPRLADGKKDLDGIADLVQRALNDLDVGPNEKVFASETVPIVNIELDTARARKMAELDYVCAITSDRNMWPLD